MSGRPATITVKLGIVHGRQSPSSEPPQVVRVYANAKVNWFFLDGAFVLQSVHKRDHAQLEKDFDLYLKRPGSRGDICLNPSRDISEYGIKKDDELEFRHKAFPISVDIDLYPGELRRMEVNSGHPVMDIVPAICKEFGIKHSQELSLAQHQRNTDVTATQYQWLDQQSSLNGQGIKDGDTLVMRKKFFILNDDVQEAMKGNVVLLDLLYHQIHDMFVGDNLVGVTGNDKQKTLARVCCYLHHIEQKEQSISDEVAVSKVIPKCRQHDENLPPKLITVYFQERMVTWSREQAKSKLLEFFLHPQSILMTYYPVKIEEDPQEYALVCHSSAITLCTVEDKTLQPVDDKEWRYINIRHANCTHKQQIVSVHAFGSRHEFNTHYPMQISTHIVESLALMKQKALRNRKGSDPTPTPAEDPVAEPVRPPSPQPSSPSSPPTVVAVLPEPPSDRKVTRVSSEPPPPPLALLPEPPSDRRVTRVSSEPPPPPPTVITVLSPTPEPPSDRKVTRVTVPEKAKRPKSQEIEVVDEITPLPNNPPPVIKIHVPPPPSIVVDEPETLQLQPAEDPEEEKKEPLTPITDINFPPTLHIPEYFGLDFRQVLRDYRLFHIVVMNKDKRTLLLNIKKPVREVIANACAIFNIHNHERQKLWMPRGKRNVLQKYGGKPKKRIGKFLRKTDSLPSTPPELELESDKNLEKQYNFSIKPLVIHLHYRQPQRAEEDTDHAVPYDEVDIGMEWPPHETTDVRSYRQFYQSWCGAVQGAYPMIREDATRLAALLTHVYYGDRALYKSWPPVDYDVKTFLPETYCKTLGIAGDVEKAYKRLSGKTVQECIIETSEFCSRKVTHQGIFYEVSVPGENDILSVIHWKKMQPQLFGINSHGVFSVDKESGQVLFTHRFSDIFDWKYGENTFKLNLSPWSKDYHAYTYQREEILDTLQLYIDMTRSGVISQAPSRPPSMMEDLMEAEMKKERQMDNLGLALRSNSPQFSINISVSPESSPAATPDSQRDKSWTPDSTRDVTMSAV